MLGNINYYKYITGCFIDIIECYYD